MPHLLTTSPSSPQVLTPVPALSAGPTLWGILPYAGLKFYIYESLRDLFPDPGGYSVTQKLGCGAVAGVVAQTVTYPLDVVRRQMQVGDVSGRHRGLASRGTWGGVVGIVREQGWRQLYAGLHINFFKVRGGRGVSVGVVARPDDYTRGTRGVTLSTALSNTHDRSIGR